MESLIGEEEIDTKPKINKVLIISIVSTLIILIAIIIIIVILSSNSNSSSDNKENEDEETKPIIILPESGTYTQVICFAHGLGSNPENYSSFFQNLNFKLKNETKIILFRAPTIYLAQFNVNLTAWFDFWIDYETPLIIPNVTMLENHLKNI